MDMNLSYAANSVTKHLMRAQFCQAFWQLNRKYRTMNACDLFKSLSLFICVSVQFSSVQFSCSVVSDSATPWTAARQASLSITNSRSLPKLMSIESVMPSNHLILCRPLLLLPSVFPRIRVFSNESALHIRWPKYWSFSFTLYIYLQLCISMSMSMYRYIKPLIYLHNYSNIYVNYMPVILMPS